MRFLQRRDIVGFLAFQIGLFSAILLYSVVEIWLFVVESIIFGELARIAAIVIFIITSGIGTYIVYTSSLLVEFGIVIVIIACGRIAYRIPLVNPAPDPVEE